MTTAAPTPAIRMAASREVKLLVSVRDAHEVPAALAGGADIIDVKEPARGPLGRADAAAIHAIARGVGGRVPLSIALGELGALDIESLHDLPASTMYVKAGMAGMVNHDWPGRLDALRLRLTSGLTHATLVPVAYWDWPAVDAPQPDDVLAWAAARVANENAPGHLLIDTACKDGPGLLERPGDDAALKRLLYDARQANIRIALAGRLMGTRLSRAAALGPAILGVRSAACEGRLREGTICEASIQRIKATMSFVSGTGVPPVVCPKG